MSLPIISRMAPLFLIGAVILLALGTTGGTTTTEQPAHGATVVGSCSTTKISSSEQEIDHAWVLEGFGRLVNQVGWKNVALANVSLETRVQLGEIPGEWNMKIQSNPSKQKLLLCLNYVPSDSSEMVKALANAAVVKGNNSLILKRVLVQSEDGNPPPPPHRTPHHPPHVAPGGHQPPHLKDKMHRPASPHHPPHVRVGMESDDNDNLPSSLQCENLWTLCPMGLSHHLGKGNDSTGEIAIVFSIKAISIIAATQNDSSIPSSGCSIPSFASIMEMKDHEDEDEGGRRLPDAGPLMDLSVMPWGSSVAPWADHSTSGYEVQGSSTMSGGSYGRTTPDYRVSTPA